MLEVRHQDYCRTGWGEGGGGCNMEEISPSEEYINVYAMFMVKI